MPAKPSWLLNIPDILDELAAIDVPVIDRAMCERLFGVRRRRAAMLMQQFGGYRSGNTVLIDKAALIRQLETIRDGGDAETERIRKQRLADRLKELHCHRAATAVKISVRPDVHDCKLADLPPGVELTPGKLIVAFAGAEQLLSKLYEFSQAVANDYDRFCDTVQARAEHAGR